jgi:asparagine synthase (glutamine-hydrolysing)
MCGIAGVYSPDSSVTIEHLTAMGDVIFRRGPDSSGYWISDNRQLGFAHRRLAIVDLTAAGHQPMPSSTGRYMMAYNGEVYNHLEIRQELDLLSPRQWCGHSDTETLLAAIEQWGLKQTLQKSVGMFALALWDTQLKQLMLARDRFGEKPLYYGWQQGQFIFGSELKALRAHPAFVPDINRGAIALLLRHNYIPAPYSIYTNIGKLLPGTMLTLSTDHSINIESYWSAQQVITQAVSSRKSAQDHATQLTELEQVLKQAVAGQMMADVPLGAFLSGGIDSSLIVALMQSQSNKPVKTFSIGVKDPRFNEAEFAKAVANHLGTEHTELYVTDEDALAVVPKLAEIYDEPFADSSQIPTYLVSQLARQHVTVSLSGDAGDEVFCGYNRYIMTAKLWHKINRTPLLLRKLAARVLTIIPVSGWNAVARYLPQSWRLSNLGDKLHKAATVLTCNSVDQMYLGLVSHWHNPQAVVLNAVEPATALTDPLRRPELNDNVEQMMALDTVSYLPDDILVKVDRAAMASSLETRVPFLDHRVFEYAWSMSFDAKLNAGVSKWCLRELLFRYVPRALIERPKMGFAVPLDAWLRGPLKHWAGALLDKSRLQQEGFFDADIISDMWQQHLSGKHNWQYQLWDILMFQSWYETHHK